MACKDVTASNAALALESAETSRDGEVTESEQVGWLAMEVKQGSFMSGHGHVHPFYMHVHAYS